MRPSLILIIFSISISFSVAAENAINAMKQIFIKSWVHESWGSGKHACLSAVSLFLFFPLTKTTNVTYHVSTIKICFNTTKTYALV